MAILDSGQRREFDSGAVRDIVDGKGRCDLLPLDSIGEYMIKTGQPALGHILRNIYDFIQCGSSLSLMNAISDFSEVAFKDKFTAILEVAKHYEQGCNKYGERNWEKGIPVHCYIDSGVRHLLKYFRGDDDEPHDRAFLWNMFGADWTANHHPNLADLPFNHDALIKSSIDDDNETDIPF